MYRSLVVALAVASLFTFASCAEQKTPSTVEGTTSTAEVQTTGSSATGTVGTEASGTVIPRADTTSTETPADPTTSNAAAGTVVAPATTTDTELTVELNNGNSYTEKQILDAVACLKGQGSNYTSLGEGFELQLSTIEAYPHVYPNILKAIGEAILFYQSSATWRCI